MDSLQKTFETGIYSRIFIRYLCTSEYTQSLGLDALVAAAEALKACVKNECLRIEQVIGHPVENSYESLWVNSLAPLMVQFNGKPVHCGDDKKRAELIKLLQEEGYVPW